MSYKSKNITLCWFIMTLLWHLYGKLWHVKFTEHKMHWFSSSCVNSNPLIWKTSFSSILLHHDFTLCFYIFQMWLAKWLNWTKLWRNTKSKKLNVKCSLLVRLPKNTVWLRMDLWPKLSTTSSGNFWDYFLRCYF